jgi:hypothetical protein
MLQNFSLLSLSKEIARRVVIRIADGDVLVAIDHAAVEELSGVHGQLPT